MTSHRSSDVGFAVLGSAAAIVVAGVLEPARDQVGAANVALALGVLIVIIAAWGARLAGGISGVVAALAFNFFHTAPVRSLRISSGKDVVTVVLLALLGVIAGELAAYGRVRADRVAASRTGTRWLERVGRAVASGDPIEDVWVLVRTGLLDELGAVDCELVLEPLPATLPTLDGRGRIELHTVEYAGGGLVLPPGGVQIAIAARGRRFGQVVVHPAPGRGTSREQREIAAALVDQLAVVLDRSRPDIRPTLRGRSNG